jgi:hypothetical protein
MTDAPTLAAPDLEKFAHNEYNSVTQIFSSGLQAMAVLLTLFFLFTGAMLGYVGGLFTDMGKTDIQPVRLLWGVDFRILVIYGVFLVGSILTAWSLCFVMVFRQIAGQLFERASQVEALYPNLSGQNQSRLFTGLHHWYVSPKGQFWRRGLYRTTVAFYCAMGVGYFFLLAAGIAAQSYHR